MKKQLMDAQKKKALGVDLRKAKTDRQMCAFLDKPENEAIRALFEKYKVTVEDDESYRLSQPNSEDRAKLNFYSGKKEKGRPKADASILKLAKIVKSIVKESAPTANVFADTVERQLEFAAKNMGSSFVHFAFYDYVDNHCYPFFQFLLENPSANVLRFKGLGSDDFIYLVFKYYLEHPDMTIEQQTKLRDFAQSKFFTIPTDFDMSLVPVKDPSRLAMFYKSYAQRID